MNITRSAQNETKFLSLRGRKVTKKCNVLFSEALSIKENTFCFWPAFFPNL
jgi:hypothetical protein